MLGRGLDEQPVLSELSLHAKYRADSLQLGPWKLLLDHTGRSVLGFAKVPGGPPVDDGILQHLPEEEPGERALLFRIDRDPAEQHDVADQHPEVVARMRATLEALQRRARNASATEINVIQHSAEELELIRQLGYVGDEVDSQHE